MGRNTLYLVAAFSQPMPPDSSGRSSVGNAIRLSGALTTDGSSPVIGDHGNDRPDSVASHRRPVALLVSILAASQLMMGCDTAESSRSGIVTSRSDVSLCFNPEDPKQTPECFDIGEVSVPDEVQPGVCIRTVASLADKLLRVEILERECRVPNR